MTTEQRYQEARDLVQGFAEEVEPLASLTAMGDQTSREVSSRLRRLVHLADVFLGEEECRGWPDGCEDHPSDEEREPERVGYARENPRGGWNT